MLSMLKDIIVNILCMYVCMYVYYCTVAIVYALFCFHMGFIAFWTCLINLLTYLLTYLFEDLIRRILLMYTPGIVLINNRTVSIVGHALYLLHV